MRFYYNVKKRKRFLIGSLSIIAIIIIMAFVNPISKPVKPTSTGGPNTNNSTSKNSTVYYDRFMELFHNIQNKGYLSKDGIPYHSLETLIVEAPDYGHLSTSESFSFLVWLGATYGKLTGDWSYYKEAWDKTEKYIIPSMDKDQPGSDSYKPEQPSQYMPEGDNLSDYPVLMVHGIASGKDPLTEQLEEAYGTKAMYQMHWLLDTDNWYKYGNHGDGKSLNSFINTYQRGPHESVWKTVPHPSWEDFTWGAKDKGGFLPIFSSSTPYSKQWRYTSASDADSRQVQASYWAYIWAKQQNKESEISSYSQKASKMGDYLRYTLFDKYFRPIGIQNKNIVGTGYNSCHYLLSWYTSWGGALDGTWSWKIGSSHNHQGYQNLVTAFALSSDPVFQPKSKYGKQDWEKSLQRQIEFFHYLQSSEGAISGGVTNSLQGRYLEYPEGTSTFYGMAYDQHPVYNDPPSNNWFGFQAWSMERVMEYYFLSGDDRIQPVCDKWVAWALKNTKLKKDGSYEIPSNLEWSGKPDTWTGKPTGNPSLHCKIKDYTNDVGVTASYIKALIYYAASKEKHKGATDTNAKNTARELLDRMWNNYRDDVGIAVPEVKGDYYNFFESVYIPKGYKGINGQGAKIQSDITFIDMRPEYKKDPMYKEVEKNIKNGQSPVITYHRFWAQAEIAMANAMFHIYFQPKEDDKTAATDSPSDTLDAPTITTSSQLTLQTSPGQSTASAIKPTSTSIGTPDPTGKSQGYSPTPLHTKSNSTPSNKLNTSTPTNKLNSPSPTKNTNTPTRKPNTPTRKPNTPTKKPNTPTPKINSTSTSAKITIQYSCGNTNNTSNSISPKFKIVNNGNTSVDLSEVKIHYYYTIDGDKTQTFWCDWSSVGNSNVTGSFIKLNTKKSKADYYLEIGFKKGSGILQAGKSIEVQTRFSKNDWSNYDQTNDYSFNGNLGSYSNWNNTPGFISDKKVFGNQP